jgi:alginate O-acetyltransferase complex protein AlgI
MWAVAIAIYGSLKWLTFATSPAAQGSGLGMSAGYLILWTGMDAEAFFGGRQPTQPPRWGEWAWAAAQAGVGFWLLVAAAPTLIATYPIVAGWLAMVGVVSILHFGLSHVLSLLWRAAGVDAEHIMQKPVLARSLSDFWGRRWNLAFRDLAHRFVFQPLAPRVSPVSATMAVFLVSGVIHDAVISYAAGGGWGLPTLYFLIQGGALLLERSRWGKRAGLGRGVVGWLFAAIVVAGPAGLVFHEPFITRVVLPMVEAIAIVTR